MQNLHSSTVAVHKTVLLYIVYFVLAGGEGAAGVYAILDAVYSESMRFAVFFTSNTVVHILRFLRNFTVNHIIL